MDRSVRTGAAGPVVRQSLSSFWHRRLGGLCPVFSCPVSVIFYFMLFSMPISRLQRLFRVCDVFHDFNFVSFWFRSPAFFRNFFFRPSLLLVAACARFLCGDRGRSLFEVPGVDCPLEPRFRPFLRFRRFHLSSSPRSSARPRLPRCFRTISQPARIPNFASSPESQGVAFLKERARDKP